MKRLLKIALFLLICFTLPSCFFEDDHFSSEEVMSTIRQYKWVCKTSDEPLVDDDYEWIILDDYTTILYFVSDYECVISYSRKHYDSDDGTSYTRDSKTVRYLVQGSKIQMDDSDYAETDYDFHGDYLSSSNFIYNKEVISSSDKEWINEHYTHIDIEPDESTSKAFHGLKRISLNSVDNVVFGNPQCDDSSRLTYYKTWHNRSVRYEYYADKIICKAGSPDDYYLTTYSLSNGLITSFVRQTFYENEYHYTDYYTIHYDDNDRIVMIYHNDGEDTWYSKYFYSYKWDDAGNIYRSEYRNYNEEKPSYVYTYDYLPSKTKFPSMIHRNEMVCPYYGYIDPILLIEGFYGNSIPQNNLRSIYGEMVSYNHPNDRDDYSYLFDSKDRIIKLSHEYEDIYDNGKDNFTNTYIFSWE